LRLLGNLYIKKASEITWSPWDPNIITEVEGWLEPLSRIRYKADHEKNRLCAATIELDKEEDVYHELEHYYLIKTLLSIGIKLEDYFKATVKYKHKMMSDYEKGT